MFEPRHHLLHGARFAQGFDGRARERQESHAEQHHDQRPHQPVGAIAVDRDEQIPLEQIAEHEAQQ